MEQYKFYIEQIPNENEPDKKTIDKVDDQDEQLIDQINIPKYTGRKRKRKSKRKRKIRKYNKHLKIASTKFSTKSRKVFYGKSLEYKRPQKGITNPKNDFLKKYKNIYDLVYKYFDDKVSHFISQRVIELKNAFVDFALIIINLLILGDGKNQWQLVGIDYKTFCANLTKGFIDYYLDKKLDELFILFQTKNEGELKDNNKKVINYIRSNREKELFANEYLDKNFYELVEDFNKKRLNKYLIEKEGELYNEYKKKGKQIADIEVRIKAYDTLIRTLCINFREYSESIQGRKKKEKKEEIILSPYFDS